MIKTRKDIQRERRYHENNQTYKSEKNRQQKQEERQNSPQKPSQKTYHLPTRTLY